MKYLDQRKSETKPTLLALKKEAAINRLKKSEMSSPVLSHRSSLGSFEIEQRKSISPQQKISIQRQDEAVNNLAVNSSMSRKSPQRATVTKKTRTYVVDGVEGIIFNFFQLNFF